LADGLPAVFSLTPEAIADDGLLEICLVQKVAVPKRLRILPTVTKAQHLKFKEVTFHKEKKRFIPQY